MQKRKVVLYFTNVFRCPQVIIALSVLLAVALADHAPSYHAPEPKHGGYGGYKEPQYGPAKYEYKYGVDAYDAYSNPVQFGANEARDGYSTYGSYHVALPDGRLQTVTYNVADQYSGAVMDVKYSDYGKPHEVHHSKGYHAEPKHEPKYHPQPKYHSKPIHKAPVYHA